MVDDCAYGVRVTSYDVRSTENDLRSSASILLLAENLKCSGRIQRPFIRPYRENARGEKRCQSDFFSDA